MAHVIYPHSGGHAGKLRQLAAADFYAYGEAREACLTGADSIEALAEYRRQVAMLTEALRKILSGENTSTEFALKALAAVRGER